MTNRAPTTSTPPPPPPPPPAIPASTERLHHPVALFAVTTLIGLLVAFAVGIPVGALVAAASLDDCSPSDGWCGLGAALAGLFAGTLIGGIAYIVSGVAIVRRCRDAGRRAGHIAAHLVAPVALLILAGLATNL